MHAMKRDDVLRILAEHRFAPGTHRHVRVPWPLGVLRYVDRLREAAADLLARREPVLDEAVAGRLDAFWRVP